LPGTVCCRPFPANFHLRGAATTAVEINTLFHYCITVTGRRREEQKEGKCNLPNTYVRFRAIERNGCLCLQQSARWLEYNIGVVLYEAVNNIIFLYPKRKLYTLCFLRFLRVRGPAGSDYHYF